MAVKTKNIKYFKDAKHKSKSVQKGIFLIAESQMQTAKLLYIPIETHQLIDTAVIEEKGTTTSLVSGNYTDGGRDRYNYKDSQVAKNSNKYQWWERSWDDIEPKVFTIIERNL